MTQRKNEKYEAMVAAVTESERREIAETLTVKELRELWESDEKLWLVQSTKGVSRARKADWVETVVHLAGEESARRAKKVAAEAAATEADAVSITEMIQPVPRESKVEDFRNQLAKLQEEREFVRICDLKVSLNWPRDVFDGMLRELRDSMTINMAQADRSLLTDEEYANSFTDENGYVMGLISWDRWSEVEPCDDVKEQEQPAPVETAEAETVAPATEIKPAPAPAKLVSCRYDFSACKDEKKLRSVLNAAKVE